jgi:hypothetical protein
MSILKNFVNPWGLDTGVWDTRVLNISMVNRTDNERYDYYNEKGEFVKTENKSMPIKNIYIRGITKLVSLLELRRIQKEHGLYQELLNSWVRTGDFCLIKCFGRNIYSDTTIK